MESLLQNQPRNQQKETCRFVKIGSIRLPRLYIFFSMLLWITDEKPFLSVSSSAVQGRDEEKNLRERANAVRRDKSGWLHRLPRWWHSNWPASFELFSTADSFFRPDWKLRKKGGKMRKRIQNKVRLNKWKEKLSVRGPTHQVSKPLVWLWQRSFKWSKTSVYRLWLDIEFRRLQFASLYCNNGVLVDSIEIADEIFSNCSFLNWPETSHFICVLCYCTRSCDVCLLQCALSLSLYNLFSIIMKSSRERERERERE